MATDIENPNIRALEIDRLHTMARLKNVEVILSASDLLLDATDGLNALVKAPGLTEVQRYAIIMQINKIFMAVKINKSFADNEIQASKDRNRA